MPVIQRLGYLLELTGARRAHRRPRASWSERHKPKFVSLEPESSEAVSAAANARWRVLVNTSIEVET